VPVAQLSLTVENKYTKNSTSHYAILL